MFCEIKDGFYWISLLSMSLGGKNMARKRNGSAQNQAFLNTTRSFKKSLLILVGVLMLLALADVLIPKEAYRFIFSGNWLFDPLIGAVLGSISGGNPLLAQGGRGPDL
jgi:hypothetical protein